MTSGTSKRKWTTSFLGKGNVKRQIPMSTVVRMQIKAVEQLSYLYGHSPFPAKAQGQPW